MSAVMEEEPEFFAPSNDDAIDGLIKERNRIKDDIESVSEFMKGPEMQAASQYFFDAQRESARGTMPDVSRVFQFDPAIKALDADYWKRALDLTDVMDYMPDAKRHEWYEQIKRMECPTFDEATVRDNLTRLLAQRMDFLSEMVDGIFTGLSGEHVTNRPEGFSKRMIIDYVYSDYGMPGRKEGLIQDFRSVIAKLMGRDQPKYGESRSLLMRVRKNTGEWFPVDGNAFRIRVYKKGTAHLEVHPQIAWRLNQILAHRHPAAIPPKHRQRPKKQPRSVELFDRPLPFAVVRELSAGRYDKHNTFKFAFASQPDKHIRNEAKTVLEMIGGVRQETDTYQFDYDASEIIDEIVITGMVPDKQSYQFYPTPPLLAEEVVERADIKMHHKCLEPSAGQGAIADLMGSEPFCIEVSDLHARILVSKGYKNVYCGDFMQRQSGYFDRICMNPPYSQGRAVAHVYRASELLAPGGRLVAVLPASCAGKDMLPGLVLTWSPIYENQFPGTSMDVVILTAEAK